MVIEINLEVEMSLVVLEKVDDNKDDSNQIRDNEFAKQKNY